MRRGDSDAVVRSSFSFGGSHGTHQASGGGSSDSKTAAQLRKLQRLVETLVVRELERSEGPAGLTARQGARPPPEPRSQPPPTRAPPHGLSLRSGDSSGGGGRPSASRRLPGRFSSNGSDESSLDNSINHSGGGGSDLLGYSAYGPRGVPGHYGVAGSAGRGVGARAGSGAQGGAMLDDGVHLQVAALQGQLAVLGEQLSAAYRAAEGVNSPLAAGAGSGRASAPAAGGFPKTSLRPPPGHYGNGVDQGAAYELGTSGRQTAAPNGPGRALVPVGLPPHVGHSAGPGLGVGTARTAAGGVGASGGGGGVDSAALDGLSGGSSSVRARQVAEERSGRESGSREDERLRHWIQELRAERRRLEDRLLDGDSTGASGLQQLRDDLEKQVLSLSRQRDELSAELNELGATRAGNTQLAGQVEALAGQVEALAAALAAEEQRAARYQEVRPALEGRLADVSATLEALRRQHVAAVDALASERDAALQKAKRSAKRTAELEAALDSANADVRRLQDELRTHMVTLAEMRASSDVLQSASQQMQVGMEAHAKEAASRMAAVQAQLESSQSEVLILRRQLDTAQQAAATLRDQLKDAHARLEAQAADRDRLAGGLGEEQRATAAARQQVEALAAQLKVNEEARADAARAAAAQLEAVRRQHAADMAATQKQYESQLAVAEKQYLLLQRQYDAGLASNDMAAETAASLRRERDALWAEGQNLRAELEEVRREKADVSAKLTAVKSEVRAAVEEVARDRDARLAAATATHEAQVREVRAEGDRRVAAVKLEYETRLTSVMDAADKLMEELHDAQRQTDKHHTTVNHLKDQVRDLLLSRDAAERELASERAFNEELNRILTTIRAEQQQQHLHQQHTPGLRLSSPAD